MTGAQPPPSARQAELLEAGYAYALTHGLADLSLRPLAAAIGSSPRVLMFLFGNKDGLVRALLARARADELAALEQLRAPDDGAPPGLRAACAEIWSWLSSPAHRPLLTLWLEGYARSLVDPDGAWTDFARATVSDWLEVLALAQSTDERDTPVEPSDVRSRWPSCAEPCWTSSRPATPSAPPQPWIAPWPRSDGQSPALILCKLVVPRASREQTRRDPGPIRQTIHRV